MIAFTYAASGRCCCSPASCSRAARSTATTHTSCGRSSFFFASAAASSAYLTVSEIFPLELRALAIALFYAVGTGTGGLVAPTLFGMLIESGSRMELFYGYALGGALMIGAALVARRARGRRRAARARGHRAAALARAPRRVITPRHEPECDSKSRSRCCGAPRPSSAARRELDPAATAKSSSKSTRTWRCARCEPRQ